MLKEVTKILPLVPTHLPNRHHHQEHHLAHQVLLLLQGVGYGPKHQENGNGPRLLQLQKVVRLMLRQQFLLKVMI